MRVETKIVSSVLAQVQPSPRQQQQPASIATGFLLIGLFLLALIAGIFISGRKKKPDRLSYSSPEEHEAALKIAKEYAAENLEASAGIMQNVLNSMKNNLEETRRLRSELEEKNH